MTDRDSLVLHDEPLFFQVIQTMPDADEADELLRRARQACLRERNDAERRKDGGRVHEVNRLITRINDEIHHVAAFREASRIRGAIIAVLGREAYEQVRSYLIATDTRRKAMGGGS